MRCYHFGNMYLSSIQQGIQAAHCQMELFVKYNPNNWHPNSSKTADNLYTDTTYKLYKWAEKHKTMICLNAGGHRELLAIEEFINSEENPHPWASFRESEEAMGGLLTNVAIVLPEKIYGISAKTVKLASRGDIWSPHVQSLSEFEKDLICMMDKYRLAR